jgi:hypothetical protein
MRKQAGLGFFLGVAYRDVERASKMVP